MIRRLTMTEDEAMHVLGYTNPSGRYKFSNEEKWKEAIEKRDEFRGGIVDVFGDHCEERGIDKSNVIEYWDKTQEYSIRVRPEATKDDLTPEYIKDVISGINFDKKPIVNPGGSNEILRVIITDVHIGMETDETGYGMFNDVWNEKEAFRRLDIVLEECERVKRNFKEVHVIDAGDYMDGWDGQTT